MSWPWTETRSWSAPPSEDSAAENAGAVYVFTRSGGTWSETAKLTASDAGTSDQFGWSVAVSGDTAVVGANLADTTSGTNSGAAYVFRRIDGAWTELVKLLPEDLLVNDWLGDSVALDGDTAMVGAPQEGSGGAGYVRAFDLGLLGQPSVPVANVWLRLLLGAGLAAVAVPRLVARRRGQLTMQV